jgi:nucleoside-diphosphate-sugar epimerase
MDVLVTGASGFIGSHLVEALRLKKYKVYCLIREESHSQWLKDLGVELVKGNYTDKESLNRAVKGKAYVFHVGAVIDALDWETYYKGNVQATTNLLEACVESNPGLKKFVFVSSIAAAGTALHKKPLTENDECKPVSLYGKSKLMAETAAAGFFDKMPIVILRPTNVLGIRQKQLQVSLKMAKKRIIPLLGNGEKQTTICFVEDVVRALIMAAENEKVQGRTYFVANKEFYSWREISNSMTRELDVSWAIKIPYPVLIMIAFFAEKVAKLIRGTPLLTRSTLRSVRNHYWLHDTGLIEKELGFLPDVQFEQGLREIVHWYKGRGLI